MIRSATNNALYAIVFGMEGNINKNNFILTSKWFKSQVILVSSNFMIVPNTNLSKGNYSSLS
jgi:hypothetical protein